MVVIPSRRRRHGFLCSRLYISTRAFTLSDLNRHRTLAGAVNRGASEFSCRPEEVSSSSSLSYHGGIVAAGKSSPAAPSVFFRAYPPLVQTSDYYYSTLLGKKDSIFIVSAVCGLFPKQKICSFSFKLINLGGSNLVRACNLTLMAAISLSLRVG
jgi:hypothetical protein